MTEATSSGNEEITNEDRLLELAKSRPEGISNENIKQCIPNLPLEELAVIINKCLKNGYDKIEMRQYNVTQ
jgi:hypothetical protein